MGWVAAIYDDSLHFMITYYICIWRWIKQSIGIINVCTDPGAFNLWFCYSTYGPDFEQLGGRGRPLKIKFLSVKQRLNF